MTTYPLTTLACTVDANGITAPSFADILASLKASYQLIYGADAYLEPDSQDGQLLAVFAQAIHDTNDAEIATYNQFSPATAQGAGLASVVKINGIKKEQASSSTVACNVVGVAGTEIVNGIVQDGDGNQWNLPPLVIIDITGAVTVTATAVLVGSIAAGIQNVIISTPTLGWQTASFVADATVGAPIEPDAQLRKRQSRSTALPAQSIIGGLYGSIANLVGVEALKIYENDTDVMDANGLPPHSIAVVIEGGDATQIAQAIEKKKTPGTNTFGNIGIIVADPVGLPLQINFFIPLQITISVALTIKAEPGYVDATGTAIQQSIVDFVNNLGIGGNHGGLFRTALYGAAYKVANNDTFNVTVMHCSIFPATPDVFDLVIPFNQLPICALANITLTVT